MNELTAEAADVRRGIPAILPFSTFLGVLGGIISQALHSLSAAPSRYAPRRRTLWVISWPPSRGCVKNVVQKNKKLNVSSTELEWLELRG